MRPSASRSRRRERPPDSPTARSRLRRTDATTDLHHFAIVTFDCDADRLAALLPLRARPGAAPPRRRSRAGVRLCRLVLGRRLPVPGRGGGPRLVSADELPRVRPRRRGTPSGVLLRNDARYAAVGAPAPAVGHALARGQHLDRRRLARRPLPCLPPRLHRGGQRRRGVVHGHGRRARPPRRLRRRRGRGHRPHAPAPGLLPAPRRRPGALLRLARAAGAHASA